MILVWLSENYWRATRPPRQPILDTIWTSRDNLY